MTYFVFSQMGSGNLNMAKVNNFHFLARLWRSDKWDDVLVPGDGPRGSLDAIQLTSINFKNLF